MSEAMTVGTNELKRMLGLSKKAFDSFCERTHLATIPDSDKYNIHAVQTALQLDGYVQIIEANLGDVSEAKQASLRLLLHQQRGREPQSLPKVAREIRRPTADGRQGSKHVA